jgi:hypothetical protein
LKAAWELLIGIFIINLTVGVVMGLALPGTGYVANGPPVNATDYEQHFNGTAIAKGWSGTPFSGIPIIGDIFSGLGFLWQNVQYIVDGLPMFLNWIKNSYITDASAQLAFDVIANAIRAIYAFLIAMLAIEFISGRYFTE